VDVAAIEAQLPYELLPVYLQEVPSGDGSAELPFTTELDRDLSEGNHFSYAMQWFIFAAILAVGYVYFVGKRA
jgi:cytochrome oxidase assembly protein ShyY1